MNRESYMSITVDPPLYDMDQEVYDTINHLSGRIVGIRLQLEAYQNKEKGMYVTKAIYYYKLNERAQAGSSLEHTEIPEVEEKYIIPDKKERTITARINRMGVSNSA